ncbi:MAG: hypothetical protein KF729_38665 [Sandaracinaceae bacterium]|nr:hypothetical protein [Sandaracinaceae bacterium]
MPDGAVGATDGSVAIDGAGADGGPDGGGGPDDGGGGVADAHVPPPPLSSVFGDATYRPFEIALVDVPAGAVSGEVAAELGGVAVTLLPVGTRLAGFVVPELTTGPQRFVARTLGIEATVVIDAPLDDAEARALADDFRARARAALEALRDTADPEEADLVAPALEGLAELATVEADLAALSAEERRAFDHVLANLERDTALTTLDFERCRRAFLDDFRAKAVLVLRGLVGVSLGVLVSAGGITTVVGALIGGVSLAYTISVAADAARAGIRMVEVCFSGSVDLIASSGGGTLELEHGVTQELDFSVRSRWSYGPARDLLEALKDAVGRLARLPSEWIARLRGLSTEDVTVRDPDPARVRLAPVTHPDVSGGLAPAGPSRLGLTFRLRPPATDVRFEVGLAYDGLSGERAYAARVTIRCGDGVVQPGEACDGADYDGARCGVGAYAGRTGALACNTDCTIDERACVPVCGELGTDCCSAAPRCVGTLTCASVCENRGSASASLSAGLRGTLLNSHGDVVALPNAPSGTILPPGTYTFSGVVTYDFPDWCDVDIGDPISGTVTLACGFHYLIEPEGGCGANLVALQLDPSRCRGPCVCP